MRYNASLKFIVGDDAHSGITLGDGSKLAKACSGRAEEVFAGLKLTASVKLTSWLPEDSPAVVCPGLSSICSLFKIVHLH